MNIPLLFENHEIWIFAKPAGLASQMGAGVKTCLTHQLEDLFEQKVYPIHRLDAATMGLVMVAKRNTAASHYSKLFAKPDAVTKIYHAVVWGNAPRQMIIQEDIEVHGRIKSAKSLVTKLELWHNQASLLKIDLQSGRMHQIRIHLKNKQLPLVGDTKYGNFSHNRALNSPLALYASELIIPSKNIHVTLPLQQELHALKKSIALMKAHKS
jgi:23S rRNA pseudouridine955/2504/2580 synthase